MARIRRVLRAPVAFSRERGSAAVEFALVLPLLLLMTLALVQVGVFVRDQLVLTEAARAGAREAAVTASEDEIRSAVERAAEALDVSAIDMTIERSGGRGSAVAVRLSYPDTVRVPLVGWLFSSTVDLSAGATMRQEFE